MCVVTLHTQKL